MPETDTVELTLPQKLHEIAKAIDSIAKNGRNDHQHYDYVQATDVTRAIREEFLKRGIIMIPSVVPDSVQHQPAIGGKGFVTTVAINYRFIDTTSEDPENEFYVEWTGAGSDIGGDKGLYKAYTGALKYMLLTLFLIPTGDDPERDDVSEKVSKDDNRPAAPTIPIDRARSILELAQGAGHASLEGEGTAFKVELTPVFRAKLAAVGVDTGKVGHLNVDQAEDVEIWLTAEAANV